jgi:hypothetical protein
MTMPPRVRKLALTAHVTASVGWLGAVAASLGLAVAGMTSDEVQTVRAAYLALEFMGWFVLVPFAVASLLTGLVQSLGSAWGLFRHYWVVAKLFINLFATVVLLTYTQTLGSLADVAAQATLSGHDLDVLKTPSVVLHAIAALLMLLTATTLAVFKPRGLTPYGRRRHTVRPRM